MQRLGQEFEIEKPGQRAWSKGWIEFGFDALERLVQQYGGRYAFGDAEHRRCLSDPQLYNARRFDVDLSRYPALLAVESNLINLRIRRCTPRPTAGRGPRLAIVRNRAHQGAQIAASAELLLASQGVVSATEHGFDLGHNLSVDLSASLRQIEVADAAILLRRFLRGAMLQKDRVARLTMPLSIGVIATTSTEVRPGTSAMAAITRHWDRLIALLDDATGSSGDPIGQNRDLVRPEVCSAEPFAEIVSRRS